MHRHPLPLANLVQHPPPLPPLPSIFLVICRPSFCQFFAYMLHDYFVLFVLVCCLLAKHRGWVEVLGFCGVDPCFGQRSSLPSITSLHYKLGCPKSLSEEVHLLACRICIRFMEHRRNCNHDTTLEAFFCFQVHLFDVVYGGVTLVKAQTWGCGETLMKCYPTKWHILDIDWHIKTTDDIFQKSPKLRVVLFVKDFELKIQHVSEVALCKAPSIVWTTMR